MSLKQSFKSCGLCCTKIQQFGVVRGNFEILRDVNLHIHCGELTAIIGPNGAGKTTMFKALLGDVKHTGHLYFLDRKGKHTDAPIIGYVPQHLNLDRSSPVSVSDFLSASFSRLPVCMGKTKPTKQRIFESLSMVNAEHLINRKIGHLSGGELQRVLLALAFDPIPDLLLLDEPVSGIDQNGMKMFYELLTNLKKDFDLSIILISHDLALMAKYADRIALLDKTILCAGKPKDIFRHKEFKERFGEITISN